MKQKLNKKRTQLELFFEALYKADYDERDMYQTLFNPVAYTHFRSINAITASVVNEHLAESKFYEENKPEIHKIVALATAATIDVLEDIYRKNRDRNEKLKLSTKEEL